MADRSISELVSAKQIQPKDLFVLLQDGVSKNLTGQVLLNWLTAAADGHGGISTWRIEPGREALNFTLTLVLADGSEIKIPMSNGRSLVSFKKTSSSGTEQTGIIDTYTLGYNDETTSQLTITNGRKGDKGDNAYCWIKFASKNPKDPPHSFGEQPDKWLGVYSGPKASAPSNWSEYKWTEIKGQKGDIGSPATITNIEVVYQAGKSGTVPPPGKWLPAPPDVPRGQFLWSRETIQFNSGSPIVRYSASYMGIDGKGSVSSWAGYGPDASGNIDPKEWNLKVNHPIGSWWLSDDPTSPAALFGGTWEQLHGRFLLSVGIPEDNSDGWFGDMSDRRWSASVGSTGGQDYHAQTVAEMAKHTHAVRFTGRNANGIYGGFPGTSEDAEPADNPLLIAETGKGELTNNMPPYYATYMWRRTA